MPQRHRDTEMNKIKVQSKDRMKILSLHLTFAFLPLFLRVSVSLWQILNQRGRGALIRQPVSQHGHHGCVLGSSRGSTLSSVSLPCGDNRISARVLPEAEHRTPAAANERVRFGRVFIPCESPAPESRKILRWERTTAPSRVCPTSKA